MRTPGLSVLRESEEKKRNSAGSPTIKANLRCGSSTLEPSSNPNGTTVSAFMGAGKPGTAGKRTFDPDVISAWNASANAHAFAGSRQTIIRGATRDGMHQVGLLRFVLQLNHSWSASVDTPAV